MRTKSFVLILISLLIINCTTANLIKRRQGYINSHPELEPAIHDAIINGEILIGMTTEHVLASRGRPLNINSSTGEWGIHEQWVYVGIETNPRMQTSRKEWKLDHKYAYVYFENGKVTSWQSEF